MRPSFELSAKVARRLGCWLLAAGFVSRLACAEAPGYLDHQALTRELKSLTRRHPKICHLESVATTRGQRDVWRVELGSGSEVDRKRRPAMLLVAGIEGNDLAGTASAVVWMTQVAADYAQDDGIKELLDTTTLYVFPRLNPDAAESFFARPQREQASNHAPVDDDHDGLVDEDGPEDLDDDGRITGMRVQDPAGTFILDPTEPRLLIPADRSKGERGTWRLLSEGMDNDQDEAWNEDGPGGVNFNRNYPFGYKFFAPDAGTYQVSETVTRALAEFVVAHPNVGIVFTFGAADNLAQDPKSQPAGKKPPTAIHESDLP